MTAKTTGRFGLISSTTAAALLLFAMPVAAMAQTATYQFDIPAGDLGSALKAYGRASSQQLVFDAAALRGKRSNGVSGRLTADEAIARLLDGTGMVAQRTSGGVLVIRSGNQAVAASAPSARTTEIEEVVVTGTLIRDATPTSPVITISRTDIEREGLTTVQDVLARLPQNFAGVNPSSGSATGGNLGFTSQVDLRGLGSEATLTLIDGRRVTGAGGDTGRAVDLSMIPLSAVERVDVLTDGASALYGSDAIGGVVNVLLRKNFEGAETTAQYGRDQAGADSQFFSQLVGASWQGGHVLAAAQYTHSDAHKFSGIGRDTQDLRASGGGDYRLQGLLSPGNVYPFPGVFFGAPFANLTNPSGGPVFSASLPAGDGRSLTLGQLGLNQASILDLPIEDITPEQEGVSVYATAEQQVGAITLFADGVFAHRDYAYAANPELVTFVVPSTNAFSPFGEDVIMTYPLRELGPAVFNSKDEGWFANLGARGDVGFRDWTWELVGSLSRDEADTTLQTVQFIPGALLASSDPATAFNPFGDGTGQSPGVLDNLRQTIAITGVTHMEGWGLHSQGSLLNLPGGDLRLATGMEQRWESLSTTQSFMGTTIEGFPDAKRRTLALFGEFYVPIFGPDNAAPGVQELAVSAAARYENSSDFGDTFNPKIGLVWRPTPSLQFKANWGTSFRAPSLRELYQLQSLQPAVQVFDPHAPGGPGFVFVQEVSGGNPDLSSEKATTYTVAAAYRPGWLEGARLTFTYFHIDYSDRVRGSLDGIDAGTLLQFEDSLPPGVVERSPGGPGNPPAGTLTRLNITNINSATTIQAGYDLGLGYHWKTQDSGEFDVGLSGTFLDRYDDQLIEGAPVLNLRGRVGNPPKWRGQLSAAWTKKPFGAAVYVNYIDTLENDGVDPRIVQRHVDSQTTVDAQINFTASRDQGAWLNGVNVQLGVNNVFDGRPPFVDGNHQGVDLQNSMLQRRSVYLRLTKRFGGPGE